MKHGLIHGIGPMMIATFCTEPAQSVAISTAKASKHLSKESVRLAHGGKYFAAAVLGFAAAALGSTAVEANDSTNYVASATQEGFREANKNDILNRYLVVIGNVCKKLANVDIFEGADANGGKIDWREYGKPCAKEDCPGAPPPPCDSCAKDVAAEAAAKARVEAEIKEAQDVARTANKPA